MNDGGLNCLMWDPMPPGMVEGLANYSILYRKCLEDGVWRYDVMDTRDRSATVTLEGGTLREDPLKGLYEAELKLKPDKSAIEAVTLCGKCFIKRV